jgi:hypothetical protein
LGRGARHAIALERGSSAEPPFQVIVGLDVMLEVVAAKSYQASVVDDLSKLLQVSEGLARVPALENCAEV